MPDLFIDTSHHNSDAPKHPIDWPRVRAAGVARAYLKATESINFKDKAGAAQAKYFSDYVGADRGELPPAVDVEAGAAGISKATFTARLHDCLLEVEFLFKQPPVLYTSAGKWDELTTRPGWVSDYALWLAAPDRDVPPLPAGAREWWLHQYSWTGEVDGVDGDVDLDRENTVTPPDPEPPDSHAAEIRAHAAAILELT